MAEGRERRGGLGLRLLLNLSSRYHVEYKENYCIMSLTRDYNLLRDNTIILFILNKGLVGFNMSLVFAISLYVWMIILEQLESIFLKINLKFFP